MKINAMRAFLISALVIIILYTLGLFLPIIMSSKKESNLYNISETELIVVAKQKNYFSLSLGKSSTKLQGL